MTELRANDPEWQALNEAHMKREEASFADEMEFIEERVSIIMADGLVTEAEATRIAQADWERYWSS